MAAKTEQSTSPHHDSLIVAESAAALLGFHGTAGTAQRAAAAQAVCTDAASVIVLANELRAALVAKGLIKGSA